jgi:hypothetical protein
MAIVDNEGKPTAKWSPMDGADNPRSAIVNTVISGIIKSFGGEAKCSSGRLQPDY